MSKREKVGIENFAHLSVEYLHNYLRFNAFPSVSDVKKKNLILASLSVPLRKPEIFAQIVNAVNTNDFTMMENIVNNNVIDTRSVLSEILGKEVRDVNLWPILINAYFEESDSSRALRFLRNLIFFEIKDGNPEALNRFIRDYLSAKPAMRDFMLTGQLANAISL